MEIILILRSRLMVVALCSFLGLAACQNPRPETSPLEAEPTPFTSPVLPPDALSGGWQTWRAGIQPDAVNTVVISGTLWAGTSSGVARLDLQTGTYNRYEDMGKTYRVLPIEDGQAFAASVKGLFYFSDEQWRKLEFPEPFSYYSNGIYFLGIDTAGNLWLQGSNSRSVYYAHFQGHTPPANGVWRDAGDQSWPNFDLATCKVWRTITDGGRDSYLSPGQCRQLQTARAQLFNSLPPRDRDLTLIAIDGDKSLWWAYSKTLAHVTDSQTITFELPFANAYAYSLATDPAHGVWVATAQGLFYSDGVTLQQPLLELNSRTFRGTPLDIAVDAHGAVWVNTLAIAGVASFLVVVILYAIPAINEINSTPPKLVSPAERVVALWMQVAAGWICVAVGFALFILFVAAVYGIFALGSHWLTRGFVTNVVARQLSPDQTLRYLTIQLASYDDDKVLISASKWLIVGLLIILVVGIGGLLISADSAEAQLDNLLTNGFWLTGTIFAWFVLIVSAYFLRILRRAQLIESNDLTPATQTVIIGLFV